MRRRMPTRPTQRETRNLMTFYAGGTEMEGAKPRGRQPEGAVNDAIAVWRYLHSELVLERNKRRLATPPGMRTPIMLGWLCDGSADWIGYRSVVITPGMVGKRFAQFVGIEAKTDEGVLSDAQERFLNALKDAGGVAGVARNAEEAEALLR